MKTIFAIVGAFTVALVILGTFGIGNFVMIYSPDKISCVKGVE